MSPLEETLAKIIFAAAILVILGFWGVMHAYRRRPPAVAFCDNCYCAIAPTTAKCSACGAPR